MRDGAALGELGTPVSRGALAKPARSTVWRYPFPPQDTKVHGTAVDVDSHAELGEIVALDATAGWLDLKVVTRNEPPLPRGLGPATPINVSQLQQSLQRTAAEVLAGLLPLGQRLLDRAVPAQLRPLPGEGTTELVMRVRRQLPGTVLAVQGPPGRARPPWEPSSSGRCSMTAWRWASRLSRTP